MALRKEKKEKREIKYKKKRARKREKEKEKKKFQDIRNDNISCTTCTLTKKFDCWLLCNTTNKYPEQTKLLLYRRNRRIYKYVQLYVSITYSIITLR